jgi:glucose/arabinose dehydrogenase
MNIIYRFFAFAFCLILLVDLPGGTSARAAAIFNPANVVFREAVSGLVQPIFITNAGDGSNRLFIVERAGRVRVFKEGSLLAAPFLDIQSLVNDAGSEQGLLALAFHPNYETNGLFYTVYTDGNGSLVLSRFSRSAGSPDLANPNSRVPLLTIPPPGHENHNGGTLAFGRDGYLYWSTGDGGGGGDLANNAQNLNSLLGKILRLDVDRADPGLNYFIPRTNPFYNMPDRRGEIWAYGLRNPWRISFDRATGALFIGDVGQGSREEIDYQPAGSPGGQNYGWRVMEGTLCFNPSTGCNQSGKVLPVAEYSHALGCSVTGGYIYRGAFYPDLQGRYFYADFCSGILFSLYNDPVNGWTVTQVVDTPYQISTFGEDELGELYFTDYSAGKVYQMCYGPTADFNLSVAGTARGSFSPCRSQVVQKSIPGLNNGPVQIHNIDNLPGLASEQVVYRVNGVSTSFSEMMGLPASQLDNVYYLPWYNNVDLDTQLRIANVSGAPATVHVSIGGAEMTGSPFSLAAGASTRRSFPGVNSGPVKIESDLGVPIVAAERVIYKVNGVNTSFSEMMALPASQVDTIYWLPVYNNVGLDTQLRIANVSGSPATVHVTIGGVDLAGSPFNLAVNESRRVSFPGVNNGPVKIESDQPVVAAERLIYKFNGVNTSFAEMMALPDSQLSTSYWLPWYDNVLLDTQLRVANVSASPATVHVYIGGAEAPGSPFTLPAGAMTRKAYVGVNRGPLQVVSDQAVVAAQRVIQKVNTVQTSFSELMGLPASQLDTVFWLPWYNSADLDTRLRFGSP